MSDKPKKNDLAEKGFYLPSTEVVDLVAATLPGDQAPTVLHHYTSFDGLQGILRSGKLWASDASFLNDHSERVYAAEAAKAFLAQFARENAFIKMLEEAVPMAFGSTFVVCFCEDGDLLSMWRGYGAVGGFNVGFRGPELRGMLNPTFETFGKVRYGGSFTPLVQERLEAVCRQMGTQELIPAELEGMAGAFAKLLVLIKHPAFSEEREWRMVIPEQSVDRIEFRSTVLGPKPYIEVPVILGDDKTQEGPNRLPIESITIGPTDRFSETEKAIRWMLLKYGYGESVFVRRSAVPFRA